VILKEFVESIVKKIHHADKVIIDPEVDNQIAIKAYQKA
jgi:ribosomal protein L31E